jgi:hypothetical protein
MVPVLAYRIQEKEFGGLSHQARKKLQELALTGGIRKRQSDTVRDGTRLVRTWRGDVHSVTVNDSGYVYRGQRYSSLSRIAREITGTQWSGPLFFGTKTKP